MVKVLFLKKKKIKKGLKERIDHRQHNFSKVTKQEGRKTNKP